MKYLFLTIIVLLGWSCSKNEKVSLPSLLSSNTVNSNVSEPELLMTLPASWDENWFSSSAVFDLDNDGNNEIIASRHSVLYVWNRITSYNVCYTKLLRIGRCRSSRT